MKIEMPKLNCALLHNSKWWMLSPILLSLMIASIFYPGFMSYDSLHALRSARIGVTDSMWPPMVSYVWRGVDFISTNPAAMHLAQLILLLSSLFYIIYFFTKRFSSATLFLLLYLLFPVILGTTAVIWKDVLMAAFFFFSFALLLFAQSKNKSILIYGVLSLLMIFVATCLRHNAITASVPLIYYATYVTISSFFNSFKKIFINTCIFGSLFLGLIFYGKVALDHYSLPSLKPLPSSTATFMQLVRVLDIAGASICTGENLFGGTAPGLTLAEISKGYEPKHINLSQSLIDRVALSPELDKVWLSVAVSHPICILTNKILLTKYMIGAHQGTQFSITH
ncbi:MAG: hypothetical protein H7235_12445, partial [Bdellovibrionaceae bacterium]|nr:hypothetical protein [Pseudobdellovibrionaceae bacterium]